MLDPSLAARFSDHAAEWLADLVVTDPRLSLLHEEPKPHVTVTDIREVAELFGDSSSAAYRAIERERERVAAKANLTATTVRR